MIILGLLMFLFGLLSFSIKRKHLLLMLISMEMVVLSLYYVMFNYLVILMGNYFFSMIFLTFSVCEGVVGLSLLVMMIRVHGNDFFQSFNLLW